MSSQLFVTLYAIYLSLKTAETTIPNPFREFPGSKLETLKLPEVFVFYKLCIFDWLLAGRVTHVKILIKPLGPK